MPTYIVQAGENGPVKIGHGDDVKARVAQLQTAHHETLRLLRVVDTPFDAEPAFHREFAALRIRGEWFSYDARMLTFIPEADAPVGDVMRRARKAAQDESAALVRQIWNRHRHLMRRKVFEKHLGVLLECSPRRVRALRDGGARRIEVHELEGLRAIARKLDSEAKALLPMPLWAAAERKH